ncbi:MAG: hypothetical protein ACLR6J_16775 [Parabacteroides merdae]
MVTAGTGAESLKERFEQEGDTYNPMLLQTLTGIVWPRLRPNISMKRSV